jgi:hypothetical protein
LAAAVGIRAGSLFTAMGAKNARGDWEFSFLISSWLGSLSKYSKESMRTSMFTITKKNKEKSNHSSHSFAAFATFAVNRFC